MSTARASVGLLGVAAVGLAAVTALAPDLVAGLDVGAAFENDYLFVVPLGLAAVAVVLGALASRSIRGIDQATPPDPEGVPTADPAGAEFDRLVEGGWRSAVAAHRQRARLQQRLQETAIRTVTRVERCSRAAARRQVEAGTWTDDPVAAAYLAEDSERGQRSATADVGAFLRLESPLQRRARRAARAIEGAARGDRP